MPRTDTKLTDGTFLGHEVNVDGCSGNLVSAWVRLDAHRTRIDVVILIFESLKVPSFVDSVHERRYEDGTLGVLFPPIPSTGSNHKISPLEKSVEHDLRFIQGLWYLLDGDVTEAPLMSSSARYANVPNWNLHEYQLHLFVDAILGLGGKRRLLTRSAPNADAQALGYKAK